jgi:hypothetical protein
MDFTLQVELAAQEAVETVYKNFFQCAISRTEPNSVNSDLAFLLNKKDFIISSEVVLYAAPHGKKIGLFTMCRLINRKIYVDNYVNNIVDIQGVSEIRVLILTSGRTPQIIELFSITFLGKSNTN